MALAAPSLTLEFSPDARQLATGPRQSEIVSIYDVANARLLSELPVGPGSLGVVTWHPSGKYLAVSGSTRIDLWDVKAAALVTVLEAHAQSVTTLSFDPSGNWLLSDSRDGTPRLWQPSPGREWIRFFYGANILSFSTSGRWAGVLFPGEGQV